MTDEAPGNQYHFDPSTYVDMVRSEVPAYDRFQDAVAEAGRSVVAEAVLELGVGTGETARRVLAVHPGARLVGVDESAAMLAVAADVVPDAELRVSRLQDGLPSGEYDLVVSALAVHHLDGDAKADLFVRVAERLRPGGRFVLGDVVVPEDPGDVVTPIDGVHDVPSTVAEQLDWLEAAGLRPEVVWQERDLAVLVGAKPAA
jgi:tRNA (cmo5U34)-methyltransferase